MGKWSLLKYSRVTVLGVTSILAVVVLLVPLPFYAPFSHILNGIYYCLSPLSVSF